VTILRNAYYVMWVATLMLSATAIGCAFTDCAPQFKVVAGGMATTFGTITLVLSGLHRRRKQTQS
jgi:hypothetical protein